MITNQMNSPEQKLSIYYLGNILFAFCMFAYCAFTCSNMFMCLFLYWPYAAARILKLCQLNLISNAVLLKSAMDSLLPCQAALKRLQLFSFSCVGKSSVCVRTISKCFCEQINASSNSEASVVHQRAVKLSCLFTRVIITWSDRGPDPCGSAEECLCLFVLHILKCLFVSLLEAPWEIK